MMNDDEYGYGYEVWNMKYKKNKKGPPEKMMQYELKINSIALLTSLFRHFLFFMKIMKNVYVSKKIRLKK